MAEEAGERMFVEEREVQAGQGEGLDVVEGGEVVVDACERIRGDPVEVFVLGEVQETNVGTGWPQASRKPQLKVEERLQLEVCEEVTTTSMDPTC